MMIYGLGCIETMRAWSVVSLSSDIEAALG